MIPGTETEVPGLILLKLPDGSARFIRGSVPAVLELIEVVGGVAEPAILKEVVGVEEALTAIYGVLGG
jgi:hypothetical protein